MKRYRVEENTPCLDKHDTKGQGIVNTEKSRQIEFL